MTPWPIDQPIPRLCTVTDVCRILQIGRTTFAKLDAAGTLGLIEAQRVGAQRRFTGASVKARAAGMFEAYRQSA